MSPAARPVFMLAATLLLIASCRSNIDYKTDFRLHTFEVGRTTRSELIETVGLPNDIVKDADGREHLFYEPGPRYIGRCSPCVGATLPTPSKRQAEKIRKESAEYVFDEQGILIEKHEPFRE